MNRRDKLLYLMGSIGSPWLLPMPQRKKQLQLLLEFVFHVMTDHAGRTTYWREHRVQVNWQFSGDGSSTLDISTSVGSGLDEDEVVVIID